MGLTVIPGVRPGQQSGTETQVEFRSSPFSFEISKDENASSTSHIPLLLCMSDAFYLSRASLRCRKFISNAFFVAPGGFVSEWLVWILIPWYIDWYLRMLRLFIAIPDIFWLSLFFSFLFSLLCLRYSCM